MKLFSPVARLFAFLALAAGTGVADVIAPDYPPLKDFTPDPVQRSRLTRTLTLLTTGTPTNRNTVRVLFYGQSITEQDWWKDVQKYLHRTYPHANLVIENRAIGGHSSQLLVKTAEADLYPFQPDLLIFHVYGDHNRYEDIIRRVRERTTADILLQTHHFSKEERIDEPSDPATLTPKTWNPWQNYVFLPGIAEKYGACRADIHTAWKTYLARNALEPAALLKDGVHLNEHGERLMGQLIKSYLAPLETIPAGYDPLNDDRVRTLPAGPDAAWRDETLELAFEGTGLVAILPGAANGSVEIRIDGRRPSEIPELRGATRTSVFPQSNWPMLLRVAHETPPLLETWTAEPLGDPVDPKNFRFRVRGSVTGDDGEGVSTNRFVSRSGRVVIDPSDWNLDYCVKVFRRPLPPGTPVTWRVELRGTDRIEGRAAKADTEDIVTVANGLPPGRHTVTLKGDPKLLRVLRAYRPPGRTAP